MYTPFSRKFWSTFGLSIAFIGIIVPTSQAYAIQVTGGGYTIQQQTLPVNGQTSGGGYNVAQGGQTISGQFAGGGYTANSLLPGATPATGGGIVLPTPTVQPGGPKPQIPTYFPPGSTDSPGTSSPSPEPEGRTDPENPDGGTPTPQPDTYPGQDTGDLEDSDANDGRQLRDQTVNDNQPSFPVPSASFMPSAASPTPTPATEIEENKVITDAEKLKTDLTGLRCFGCGDSGFCYWLFFPLLLIISLIDLCWMAKIDKQKLEARKDLPRSIIILILALLGIWFCSWLYWWIVLIALLAMLTWRIRKRQKDDEERKQNIPPHPSSDTVTISNESETQP